MKKTTSWPKPKGFHLDDDSGLLIGNRIHRVVGGQVIGQQNVAGDSINVFGTPPSPRRRAKAASASKRKPRARKSRRTAPRR